MALVESGLNKKTADNLGLPESFSVFSSFPFAGMNQNEDRTAVDDKEWFVLENFIKIGGGNLRTLWDRGTTLYTAPNGKTIVKFYWYNIGPALYCAVFLSDGTAVQVDTSGNQVTITSTAGTFYTAGSITPSCCQWGTKYLLISSNIAANAYWAWDGAVLYFAGTISPVITLNGAGSAYSSPPTATAFGGAGSGIAVTPVVTNGAVTSLTITNPGTGYVPGDVVQFQFSGGGSDSSPQLTAVLAANTVQFINVLAGGSGYTIAPGVTFSGGGGGSGASATATISGGAVTSIAVTSGGSGYTSPPTIGFTGGGGGSGASAAAYLTAGTVASITVVSGGTNFTAIPSVSFQGGSGTGAAGTVVLSGGSTGAITSVTLSSGGHGYTSAPSVIVSPGQNNAAYATASLMPFVINGYAVETFESRVWLVNTYATGTQNNGGVILNSAAGSLSDFATSDGGSNFVSNEPFLRSQYRNIRQAQGYLYTFGDSAVDVISNVQTAGSPSTTTFNYQNVDPQTGIAWRDTAAYFGLSVLFANAEGAFGLYGGAVKNISRKMTKVFDAAVFPPTAGAVTPSGAVANIHTVKCYLLNMTVTDPLTNLPRTVMLGWDEQDWFIATQSSSLTYIGTQCQNSTYTAWGTDGNTLFPLFAAPSAALTKTFSTKLYGANSFPVVKQAMGLWMMTGDVSTNKAGVSMTVTMDTEAGSYPTEVTPLNFDGYPMVATDPGNFYSVNLGLTAKSTSPDFVLKHLVIGYTPYWGSWGSPPLASGQ